MDPIAAEKASKLEMVEDAATEEVARLEMVAPAPKPEADKVSKPLTWPITDPTDIDVSWLEYLFDSPHLTCIYPGKKQFSFPVEEETTIADVRLMMEHCWGVSSKDFAIASGSRHPMVNNVSKGPGEIVHADDKTLGECYPHEFSTWVDPEKPGWMMQATCWTAAVYKIDPTQPDPLKWKRQDERDVKMPKGYNPKTRKIEKGFVAPESPVRPGGPLDLKVLHPNLPSVQAMPDDYMKKMYSPEEMKEAIKKNLEAKPELRNLQIEKCLEGIGRLPGFEDGFVPPDYSNWDYNVPSSEQTDAVKEAAHLLKPAAQQPVAV